MSPAGLGPWAESALALTGLVGLLAPLGLLLVHLSSQHAAELVERAQLGILGAAAALLGYSLLGFGLQWGGVALISELPGLEHLRWEWQPLAERWGPGWGLLGLGGSPLWSGRSAELALLLHQAAPVLTVGLLPSLVLASRFSPGALLLGGFLVGGLLYPLGGNWAWGGGWLSQLGATRGLGHGLVDYGGSGVIFGLAGFVSLGALRSGGRPGSSPRGRGAAMEPPAQHPLIRLAGGVLFLLGAVAWATLRLQAAEELALPRTAANLLLAALGGLGGALVYTWFVTGHAQLTFLLQGLVGGGVAMLAGAPFILPAAALVTGAVAGVLACVLHYAVERWVAVEDPGGVLALSAGCGLWGLLAVALFATGHWGAGWNGLPVPGFAQATGLGVAGIAAGPALRPVAQGQLMAQLVGLMALAGVGLPGGAAVYTLARWLLPIPGERRARGVTLRREPSPRAVRRWRRRQAAPAVREEQGEDPTQERRPAAAEPELPWPDPAQEPAGGAPQEGT